MSFYATVGGHIRYESQEAFDKAVNLLKNGHWIDDQGYFLDETDERLSEVPTVGERVIEIPIHHARNLSRILDQLFEGGKGEVVWTSTDGTFSGGTIKDGVATEYDLMEWAKSEGETDIPDPEKDIEEYLGWMQEIEQEFFEEYL